MIALLAALGLFAAACSSAEDGAPNDSEPTSPPSTRDSQGDEPAYTDDPDDEPAGTDSTGAGSAEDSQSDATSDGPFALGGASPTTPSRSATRT